MKYLTLCFAFMLALQITDASAHGLRMTTADVALRHNKHLTITIRTSVSDLFRQMNWPGKPSSLLHLAAADKKTFSQFRSALIKLLQPIPVQAGKYALQNRRLQLPGLADLQKLVQVEVAEQALQKDHDASKHTHSVNDRQNYLRAEISGFINNNKPSIPQQSQALQIVFPAALGKILVTYSKPQTRTLSPSKDSTYYRQML